VTAAINHYYSYIDNQGTRRVDIEKGLCEIEGMYCKVLRKLLAREQLSYEDRGTLSIYVALMLTRVPGFEAELMQWNRENLIEQLKRHYIESMERTSQSNPEDELDFTLDELLDYLRNDRFMVRPGTQTRLKIVLKSALQAAKLFMTMNWIFLTCTRNTAFITSDQPLAFWGPFDDDGNLSDSVGLATPGMYKVIPLTSSLCLAIGNRGAVVGHEVADRRMVRTINSVVAANCYRFVIGRDEPLVRRIVKVTGIDRTDWEPRMSYDGQTDAR
jgi:hypothetical protein